MSTLRLTAAAALVALSGVPAAAQPAPVQTVQLYSYGYAPNPLRLRAGRPVTLAFVNRSGNGHDFTAKSFFGASRILSGVVRNGEVELGRGRSASVTLIPTPGTYRVHCGHFFHKQLGMHGTIIVE